MSDDVPQTHPATPNTASEAGGDNSAPRVKVLRDPNAPTERYVDGLLGAMVRDSVFKLEFHRVIAKHPETGEETWQVAERMVFPITAAPQLLNAMQQVMQALQEAGRLRVQPPDSKPDMGV